MYDRRRSGSGSENDHARSSGGGWPGRRTRTESVPRRSSAAPAGSGGTPLPADLRGRYESSLGADLGGVRLHTGADAAEAAESVSARAFTVGGDIHFGAGQYDPGSTGGEHLIAHEVAHTVQQAGSAAAPQYKLDVSQPGDSCEVEADHAADRMVRGEPARVSSGGAGVSRQIMRKELRPIDSNTTHKLKHEAKTPPQKCGPFLINGVAGIEGSYTVPIAAKDDKDKAKVKGGVSMGTDGELGVHGEVKREFQKVAGFTPSVKESVQVTNKKVKVSFGISAEMETLYKHLKWAPVTVEFDVVKWEHGKTPEIMAATASTSLTGVMDIKGIVVEVKGSMGLTFKPDPLEVAKWLGRGLLMVFASELGIMAGLVAGGLVLCGYGTFDMLRGSEAGAWAEGYGQNCLEYARGFQAGLRKQDIPKTAFPSSKVIQGWFEGSKALKDRVAETGIPEQTLVDEMKKKNLASEAWAQKWPSMKAAAIERWKKEHPIENLLTGGDGWGGELKLLKRVLDGYDKGPYSEG